MKPGDRWNDWTVDSQIGEGRFGKVYRIVRNDFGHVYESALKVLRIPENEAEISIARNEGLDDAEIVAYFQGMVEDIVSEFTLMSELRGNSNIVSYEDHEVVKHKDEPVWDIYIRMELLTSLIDRVNCSDFTVDDVLKLGIDMCMALELCQSKNIIHRDIKPENIFWSKTGNYKLGDFGIARETAATAAMTRAGTYSYMAPEISKGFAYNSTVDIYSLGIVLYRFLNNNRLPFLPPYPESIRHSDREEANKKRMRGDPMDPPCNAGEELSKIVLKACAYRPEERYGSALEMRKALESIRSDNTVVSANSAARDLKSGSSEKSNESLFNKDKAPALDIDNSSTLVTETIRTSVTETIRDNNHLNAAENKSLKQNDKRAGEKSTRKTSRKKITAIICGTILVLAGLAGFALYNTDYYLEFYTPKYEVDELSEEDLEYGFNGTWGYNEDKTKIIRYKDVTVRVPSNWKRRFLDMSQHGLDLDGRFASIDDADGNTIAWFQIEYLGEYSSIDEFKESELGSKFHTDGESVTIDGCDEALSLGRFTNSLGETIIANIVNLNGKCYWIGGGAVGDNFSISNMTKMLNSCEYKK